MAVSLVDGISEVKFEVNCATEVVSRVVSLVLKVGMKGVLMGMVNIVVTSGPVGTGPGPVE
jgi:hypothetical protein